MSMQTDNGTGQVATEGMWKGLHTGMGIASKVMVLCFVLFTALYVDLASSLYGAVRGWIEATLNWYYISALCVMMFVCFWLMLSRFLVRDVVLCRCRHRPVVLLHRRTVILL